MEISGNKYLHKKFKKQTSCIDYNETKTTQNTVPFNGQSSETSTKKEEKPSEDENVTNKHLKNSVPNQKSTNSEYLTKSVTNIYEQSSISLENARLELENVVSKPVSNFISKDTNELKENHFNFDTKPILNTPTLEKSSTEFYSKYNLLSERPNIINVTNEEKTTEIIEKKCQESSSGKYVCTYCNLACSKPSVLQKHIRAHTNERPYPCNSCGFSFKTRSNLYKHCRSRTHANRVMGNKHLQDSNEFQDIDNSERDSEDTERNSTTPNDSSQLTTDGEQNNFWETKTKPYKPKFHTAKLFFEQTNKKTDQEEKQDKTNPDLIKLRINELISKNNSIVNCDEAVIIRRKTSENGYENYGENWQHDNKPDEPLNLTKNRKRCLSDSENAHATDKSLIKQLLLKNLSPDPDLQCQYCRMIFQSVPELEMHKLKYCSAYNKGNNIRYARSSSVNVASILTQNKNAFDNIPHMQNSTFPLKSPGPFLGKTRLIENDKNDKYRFSFDDNAILQHAQPESPNLSKYTIMSPSFSPISPQIKKNPVKLFGGEVKITHTSGETKSFKIESEINMKISEPNYVDYGSKLSENLVIKSSLQSGGTVLQNKSNYQKIVSLPSPNILRYDNANLASPSINISLINENKFNYDKITQDRLLTTVPRKSPNVRETYNENINSKFDEKEMYKSNLIDFSQKAVKLITPNIKPPNLSIPGLPIPNSTTEKIYSPLDFEKDKQHIDNLNFAKKQLTVQKKMAEIPNLYNPLDLFVDGKLVRYVPGMPGPVIEPPLDYPRHEEKPNGTKFEVKTPTIVIDQPETTTDVKAQVISKLKLDFERKQQEKNEKNDKVTQEPRKFARPNSLALKPSSVAFKQHHGLTPTMFNQALISPDTPRVAKKFCQQYLNGNYFSYLGLKSSTKPVYCTLNKTQPFYVKHFKKLSMYSEWRQQESKIDCLSVSSYDSRQRQNKYTLAGSSKADLIVHSSYKFVITETPAKDDSNCKNNSVLGGYESNEDYTYVRGRGRGKYVCDQCGIRCKKPSMLKKHLRTHSDDRPYTCQHCNFSFKTKGNLTKHMKSKAHFKKKAETSTSAATSGCSSDSEDSDADSSDESTRLQEHEAAHCLLSLSQKGTPPPQNSSENFNSSSFNLNEYPILTDEKFLKNPEQITQVNNQNFAKNKCLDESTVNFNASKHLTEFSEDLETKKKDNLSQYLGKSSTVRPLTYPYQKNIDSDNKNSEKTETIEKVKEISQENTRSVIKIAEKSLENHVEKTNSPPIIIKQVINPSKTEFNMQNIEGNLPTNIVIRKRKLSSENYQTKISKSDEFKPIDLSSTIIINDSPILDLSPSVSETVINYNGALNKNDFTQNRFLNEEKTSQRNSFSSTKSDDYAYDQKNYQIRHEENDKVSDYINLSQNSKSRNSSFSESNSSETFSQNSNIQKQQEDIENPNVIYKSSNFDNQSEQDQSAMQTLAEIAIKQMKNEKNIMAKSVASEYLKLALKNEYNANESSSDSMKKFVTTNKDANDLIKPEENKNCSICSKNFSKPSQLRLHMNIHYLERPFRCESCSVSFRTKGHLQKHERSASHHNKLSSSPALSSSEPRPFKCSDCDIAFRIHGHLAKHLRSKMHIMKLECLAKIPFGLYAELERANSLLTEINTTDGDLCLESLKILARKLFSNDPNKLDQLSNIPENRDS